MSKKDINLSESELKTALKIMMAESGIDSLADLARNIGIKDTTFRSAINNNAIRLMDFLKVAESMGYTVVITEKIKDI